MEFAVIFVVFVGGAWFLAKWTKASEETNQIFIEEAAIHRQNVRDRNEEEDVD